MPTKQAGSQGRRSRSFTLDCPRTMMGGGAVDILGTVYRRGAAPAGQRPAGAWGARRGPRKAGRSGGLPPQGPGPPGAPSGGGGAGGPQGRTPRRDSKPARARARSKSPGPRRGKERGPKGRAKGAGAEGRAGGARRGQAEHPPRATAGAQPTRSAGRAAQQARTGADGEARPGGASERPRSRGAAHKRPSGGAGGRSAGRARPGRGAPERASDGAGTPARQHAESAKGPADGPEGRRGGTNARPAAAQHRSGSGASAATPRAARVGANGPRDPGRSPPVASAASPGERSGAELGAAVRSDCESGARRAERPLVYLILGHYSVRACERWTARMTKSVPFLGQIHRKLSIT